MSKVLVYSFTHPKIRNISNEVMHHLKNVDFFEIDCTSFSLAKADIDNLVRLAVSSKYKFIIGIGIYTTKSDLIKVERKAKNKFRNEAVCRGPEFYNISEFIKLGDWGEKFRLSDKMGNSWCNLTAFS